MSDANSQLPSNAVRNGLIAIGVFVVLLGALAFFNRGVRVPDCPGGDAGSCMSQLMSNCMGDEGDMPMCMQAVQSICRAACDPNTDWSQFSQCEIDQAMCLANGGGRLRCGRICD
jgi:hypothetical protein